MPKVLRSLPTVLLCLALLASLLMLQSIRAEADHEPAQKAAAAGDDLKATSEDEAPIQILSDRMRVSTTEDVIIQVTSECSILTSLLTGEGAGGADENTDSAFAFGQVKMFVTLDGNRVPVSTNDTATDPDEHGTSDTDDTGEVVFCNRAYQRTVTDTEDDDDGLDTTDDFIRTRTANAFNWVALDTGFFYDNPGNGNNILDVVLWAEFDKDPEACATEAADNDETPLGKTCAEAMVGSRTMIIEPIKVTVHERVAPTAELTPSPAATPSGTPDGKGNGKP